MQLTSLGLDHNLFSNIALYIVVQGIVSFLSIIGSVLLILTYMMLRKLRSKSRRLLITNLAAANFLITFPNYLAVFMEFRKRFKVTYNYIRYIY